MYVLALVDQEKKQLPVNSDVAAFASRAKVVYPINQKYRVSLHTRAGVTCILIRVDLTNLTCHILQGAALRCN